jgi:hypothetical protein
MLEVKEAVAAAASKAQELYEDKELEDLALEEVELSDDKRFWLITLGFYMTRPNAPKGLASTVLGIDPARLNRRYKTFTVDAETGKITSMKIREV